MALILHDRKVYSIPARGSRMKMILIVSVMVACLMSVSGDSSFSWSDCGVQLNKAIHYQSASISPEVPSNKGPLAINVQATIADIVYDADTRLMVWKDGVLFMDVYIDKLCTIISNTKALSCPLYVGQTSFTYKFESVPTLPSGQYVIDIKSYGGSSGMTNSVEIGCIEFVGNVTGVQENVKEDKCIYRSSFDAQLMGYAHYTTDVRTARKEGDLIQIGPLGRLPSPADKPFEYGSFVGNFLGTDDLGGEQDLKGYSWTMNGTLESHMTDSTQRIVDTYVGTCYVHYSNGTSNSINMRGLFNLTFDYDPNRQEKVTGSIWLDPRYYVLDQFAWPIVIGNLGPFSLSTADNGHFIVSGSHDFCTCGVDQCGVCNGNGRTCGLGAIHHTDDGWGVRKKAAVACGAVALLLLILVIDLSRRILKEKRRIPIDDTDLLDHPEKPDYGTMAIDDAIREGERV